MNKEKRQGKGGSWSIMVGIVLVLAALSLYLFNQHKDKMAGEKSQILVAEVQGLISERLMTAEQLAATKTPKNAEDEEKERVATSARGWTDNEMTVVEIGGYGYIGYLSVPALGLELPVMSEWDYKRLEIAPCRHFGSTKSDDLVVAAHNYASHFGYILKLKPGDSVIFTDMDGNVNYYEVAVVDDTVMPSAVDVVQNSGYDFVFYTCTFSGEARVTVFCKRVEG